MCAQSTDRVGVGANRPAARQPESERSPGTLAEAVALQAIEGNPLTPGEIAMFEMFEREGWSHERRRAHILASIKRESSYAAE